MSEEPHKHLDAALQAYTTAYHSLLFEDRSTPPHALHRYAMDQALKAVSGEAPVGFPERHAWAITKLFGRGAKP